MKIDTEYFSSIFSSVPLSFKDNYQKTLEITENGNLPKPLHGAKVLITVHGENNRSSSLSSM